MFGRRKVNNDPFSKVYLTIDIGTEFIKTAVFRINGGIAEVVGYDRAPQKQNSMRGALIINLERVIDVVDVSIGNAMHMAEQTTGQQLELPKDVMLGIAGELVKGVVILVNVERESPDEQITNDELDSILNNVKSEAFEGAKEEIAVDTGIRTEHIEEIETTINSTYIDGVKVDSPVGFRGKDLVYRVFSTFAPKIHVDSIRSVADELNLHILGVAVEPYALAMGVEDARNDRFSAIFIDVGGGTTDIAIIKEGSIVGTKMFAFGGRVFTKRLETELNLEHYAAENMKLDYSDQKLSAAEAKRVAAAIGKDIPVWLDGVELALLEFAEDIDEFPAQIFLCGGGALLPEIQSGLMAHPWLQVLPFPRFPRTSYLFPNQIGNVNDLTRKATTSMDVTPMALTRMAMDFIE